MAAPPEGAEPSVVEGRLPRRRVFVIGCDCSENRVRGPGRLPGKCGVRAGSAQMRRVF